MDKETFLIEASGAGAQRDVTSQRFLTDVQRAEGVFSDHLPR